jgi:DNA-binding CsgD family transcriptional regulator
MQNDLLLTEDDVRGMVRLIGETAMVDGDHDQQRRHLMSGLCRMLKVDGWAWTHAVDLHPDRLPVYVGYSYGGFSDDEFAKFLKINTQPDMIRLTAPFAKDMQEKRCHITRTVCQMFSPETFLASDVFPLWSDCGLFPHLLFGYPTGVDAASGVALYRREAQRYLTEREARIAHIVFTEVAWLHITPKPGQHLERVLQLSIRQRQTLEMLLLGSSRKFIAEHMGISANTVASYIKEIYCFYGVNSHSELIHRFFAGDGSDQPTTNRLG